MEIKFDDITTYQWSNDDPNNRLPIYNPATGKIITKVQCADTTTTTSAISASSNAFHNHWRHKTPTQRSTLLFRCADALEAEAPTLATLLCLENGKPRQDALAFDLTFLPAVFRYFASLCDKTPTSHLDRGATTVDVVREPHGVTAGILPFNWPPIHTGGKAAPSLAAGNTIILKPGEQAPLTCLRIVSILQTILPENVVQAIPASGPEVPQLLVTHPTVKMVSFTGSTPAGIKVNETAAPFLKPTALELGGKNAFLLFGDADLERAAGDVIDGAFFNKGEACTAASRLLVERSVHDLFVERLTGAVQKLRTGDGMDEGTHVGPCVSGVQRDKVNGFIEVGVREGASIAAQGDLPKEEKCKDGFFVRPTLLTGVKPEDKLSSTEVFGPVLTVTPFDSEEQGVELANGTRYGLTAIVYSGDYERAQRVARNLEAGMVWVNNYRRNLLGVPFGGVKESGQGREHWPGTLDEWSQTKFIQAPSGRGELGCWRGAKEVLG